VNNLLSIIITSYTTERVDDIQELLDSIKSQSYSNIEVIYVVEKSKELYTSIIKYAQKKAIPKVFILFNDGEQGLSGARNKGVKSAKGNVLAFVDDDTVLYPNWAEEIMKTFANDPTIIGLTGPAIPLWEDESMKWLPAEFQWIVGSTSFWTANEIREVRNVWGMNMSFSREAFEKYGGFVMRMSDFKEKGVAKNMLSHSYGNIVPHEDVELSLRVTRKSGKRIVYNPNVKVMHRATKNRLMIGFIMKEALHQGCAKRMMKRVYPHDNQLLNREHDVLIEVFGRLVPRTILRFPKEPYTSWRRFSITFFTLFFLGIGYSSPIFFELLGRKRK
jgi:glycosyltransferase involved in cell wall biosynthesis